MFYPHYTTMPLTIPQAINIAKWRITYAVIFLILLSRIIDKPLTKNLNWQYHTLFFILNIALIFLYWSIAVSRWRVWAFSRITDIENLYKRAVDDYILPQEGNFFRRLEWKTTYQKAFWADVRHRLIQGTAIKEVVEDFDLPKEKYIYYSRSDLWLWVLFPIVWCGGSFYAVKQLLYPSGKSEDIALIYLTPIFLAFTAKPWYNITKRIFIQRYPLIILDSIGIFVHPHGKVEWKNVHNIDVNTEGYGDDIKDTLEIVIHEGSYTYYKTVFIDNEGDNDDEQDWYEDEITEAEYESSKGNEDFWKNPNLQFWSIPLENYDVTASELEHFIRVYQARGQQKKK
jgi:hypothetical protein